MVVVFGEEEEEEEEGDGILGVVSVLGVLVEMAATWVGWRGRSAGVAWSTGRVG